MSHTQLISTVSGSGALPGRSASDSQSLNSRDTAVRAFTDFRDARPIVVDESRQIDDALGDMIRTGVRALLVMRDQGVTGLITSYDIQGERPLQFLQTSNYSRHQDICVGDIMTPWAQLRAIDVTTVTTMTAVDLLESLDDSGLTHLIVIECHANPSPVVRGIVSRHWLARQLGIA
jgi:CBS domain containing-hemolysin-like protein